MPRRVGALTAAALAVGVLVSSGGVAGAAPQPTVGQVQKKLDRLMTQQDQVIQQYDQAAQELAGAKQRLALASRALKTDTAQFQSMRRQIAQIAAAAYENGTMTSAGALLTAASPQRVLSQASMLQQLSASRSAKLRQFIAAARQVTAAQQTARRTELAVAGLAKRRLASKRAMAAAVARQQAMLNQLTAVQQAAVSGVGSTSATYSGPTNTAAGKAVAFAYQQLGKPYVWGATGPGSFDCSGLVQAAWASAGVSIPRTTYEQYSALPHVPMSAIRPGDLIFFDGLGHVAMYVGNGMIIDAPQPGESVEYISLNSPWYSTTVDGAARP